MTNLFSPTSDPPASDIPRRVGLSPKQITCLRIARARLGWDDRRWDMFKKNVASDFSYHRMTNSDFETMMAMLEEMAQDQGVSLNPGRDEYFWRSRLAASNRRANPRQVHMIQRLAAECPAYSLAGLVRRFSKRQTEDPAFLTPQQAHKLIECLKAIIARGAGRDHQAAGQECDHAPLGPPLSAMSPEKFVPLEQLALPELTPEQRAIELEDVPF
jgi:hypothetical protein